MNCCVFSLEGVVLLDMAHIHLKKPPTCILGTEQCDDWLLGFKLVAAVKLMTDWSLRLTLTVEVTFFVLVSLSPPHCFLKEGRVLPSQFWM